MSFHKRQPKLEAYTPVKKSQFYNQSRPSNLDIQTERDQAYTNLRSILRANQDVISSTDIKTPIMRKKESSKTDCACMIQ